MCNFSEPISPKNGMDFRPSNFFMGFNLNQPVASTWYVVTQKRNVATMNAYSYE